MIRRLSHACFSVLDQERACAFYVDKLGFTLHTDVTMGEEFEGAGQGFRRLTVCPPGQPDIEVLRQLVQPLPAHGWCMTARPRGRAGLPR